MAMSINCENKPFQERIAQACDFMTAGTSSDRSVGQDTGKTPIAATQGHCHEKRAWLSRNK